jgi:hypothetical protein
MLQLSVVVDWPYSMQKFPILFNSSALNDYQKVLSIMFMAYRHIFNYMIVSSIPVHFEVHYCTIT